MKAPAASYQQAQLEVSCYGINLTGHPELWFREPQTHSPKIRTEQPFHLGRNSI